MKPKGEKNVRIASKEGSWRGLGEVVMSVQTRALVLPVDIKLAVERIIDTQAIILM